MCGCVCACVCACVCINCCFNGNEVGHYIAQARRFTVAKQYQSSFCVNFVYFFSCLIIVTVSAFVSTNIFFRFLC